MNVFEENYSSVIIFEIELAQNFISFYFLMFRKICSNEKTRVGVCFALQS